MQSDLYNPALHERANLCWVVRLSNCLHNSTLTIMSDYIVKLYNSIIMLDKVHVFDSQRDYTASLSYLNRLVINVYAVADSQ